MKSRSVPVTAYKLEFESGSSLSWTRNTVRKTREGDAAPAEEVVELVEREEAETVFRENERQRIIADLKERMNELEAQKLVEDETGEVEARYSELENLLQKIRGESTQ